MTWRKFSEEMPQGECRLLTCGIINTDPFEQCTNYIYMEFVNYKDGMIIPDPNSPFQEPYEPDLEDYWMYQQDIKTPYEDK